MRCCVQNCTNDTKRTTKSHGITFHMFPKEPNTRDAWVEALGMSGWEPKDRSSICSEHFRTDDFYETKCGRRKVKCGAVPVVVLDSAEELEAPATLRVCRVCLAMDTTLYDPREYSLDKSYSAITGLVAGEGALPPRLCWECAHRLRASMAFRDKALRCHALLEQMLQGRTYITIRDIKSVNRTHNKLNSTLIQSILEPNEFDLELCDEILVKSEDTDDLKEKTETPELMEVEIAPEIKDESNEFNHNEIFFNEYTDHFQDSDDDKILSEVVKTKPKIKVKKKKLTRIAKKVKPVKVVNVEKRCEEENPVTTVDKYKTADVKRRRTADGLDETLFTITALTYEEQILEVQRRQEAHSYRHAPYQCTVCYRGFLNKTRYEVHVVRHTEQFGEYECFICKTRLKTGRALRKHLTAQHTEKFSCNGCPFVTRNRGVAREHQKWHAGTKYQCPHCPSEFDKLTTYMGHIRIKHVSDCVCELCGFTFVSKKGIEVHKKRKHRLENGLALEGPYCEICDVKFVSDEAHARHLKLSSRHSSDSDPNRIRNDSQSMNIASDRNGRVARKLERRPLVHGRDPSDRAPGAVTCEQCGVQLRNLRLYAQHFRRAHPDKNRTKYPAMKTPCMCEQCGRIFQSMALLKDHMWVHTGEKRFKCDRCPKSFTQKTNLVFHARVHSAQRPSYECPLCGKQFAFYNNRQRHMFIHTGLKPFKCDTCGKCFTTSGEQRAHVEHVHLKKPWPKRVRAQRRDGDPMQWEKCTNQCVED